MIEYVCTLCGRRLFLDETIQHCNPRYGDLYVLCPYCQGECCPDTEEY